MAVMRSSSNVRMRTDPIWATGVAVLGGLLAALSGGFFIALGLQQAGILP